MTKDLPKVLWHSNAPWASTGYGQQTGLFAPRLKEAGYDIAVSAFYGLEGNMIGWKGLPVLPGYAGTFGNETLPGHAVAHFGSERGGLVVTLTDTWVLNAPTLAKFNTACWVPVDHDPVPPMVAQFFENSHAIPIAMSRFGQERLERFDPLYVPHAVDTELYKAMPKAEAREKAGLPADAFVVGMVAANKGNPSRKCFPQALKAFKAIHDRHPEALLCLHTEVTGIAQGVDLRQLIKQFDLADAVVVADQYRYEHVPCTAEEMAMSYSSFDVLLNPSMGEGFGIPVLEAQACGVPAIVTDFTAMSEVCGAGWKVDYNPVYTTQMSYQADPLVEDIVEALEAAYRMPAASLANLASRAREHALTYDVREVMDEYMLPALAEIAERIAAPELEVVAG